MLDPKSISVKIYGHEYTLRGEANTEYVQKVAKFVDDKMREIADNSSVASTAKIAILAAINIADELFRERQKRHEALAMLEEKTGQIAQLLDKEVGRA